MEVSPPPKLTVRKQALTYYCDDCKKEITSIEERPNVAYDLLKLGVFQPKYNWGEAKDTDDLCRDCMLKLLDKWRGEVSGH